MLVEAIDNIKRQVTVLTWQEKAQIAAFLAEQLRSSATVATVNNSLTANELRRRRMDWLKANAERYGGQYVALDGDCLVSVGPTFRAAREAAQKLGHTKVFVTYLPKPDEGLEGGGWA